VGVGSCSLALCFGRNPLQTALHICFDLLHKACTCFFLPSQPMIHVRIFLSLSDLFIQDYPLLFLLWQPLPLFSGIDALAVALVISTVRQNAEQPSERSAPGTRGPEI